MPAPLVIGAFAAGGAWLLMKMSGRAPVGRQPQVDERGPVAHAGMEPAESINEKLGPPPGPYDPNTYGPQLPQSPVNPAAPPPGGLKPLASVPPPTSPAQARQTGAGLALLQQWKTAQPTAGQNATSEVRTAPKMPAVPSFFSRLLTGKKTCSTCVRPMPRMTNAFVARTLTTQTRNTLGF